MKNADDLDREMGELQQFANDSWTNLAIVQKIKSVRATADEVITGLQLALRSALYRATQLEEKQPKE